MSNPFEHQDWKPVVLKKLKQDVKPKPAPVSVVKPVEALDISDKPKFFSPEMGQKIASLRNEKGWTQEQLAQQLREPKNKIQALEQGKELYHGPFVSKLKKVLGNFSW